MWPCTTLIVFEFMGLHVLNTLLCVCVCIVYLSFVCFSLPRTCTHTHTHAKHNTLTLWCDTDASPHWTWWIKSTGSAWILLLLCISFLMYSSGSHSLFFFSCMHAASVIPRGIVCFCVITGSGQVCFFTHHFHTLAHTLILFLLVPSVSLLSGVKEVSM